MSALLFRAPDEGVVRWLHPWQNEKHFEKYVLLATKKIAP